MIVRSNRLAAATVIALLGLSACGSDTPSTTPTATNSPDASSAPAGDVTELAVTGTSALKWDPASLTAAAGEVTITLTAEGANHDFVIEELADQHIVDAAAGETKSATVNLAPGTYTYYCSVTGHRAAGMEGLLTVS